jgi:hypothetical protein
MRLGGAMVTALLLAGCPSLDGFAGAQKDAGKVDSGPARKGFLSVADAARLCSNLQSCLPLGYSIGFSLLIPMDSKTYSTCVDVLAGPLPPNRFGESEQVATLTCVAQAADCAAAGKCLPYETILPGDSRCPAVDGGLTDGCSPDGKAVYKCTTGLITHCDHPHFAGSSCVLDPNGEARCAADTSCTLAAPICSGSVGSLCGLDNYTYKTDCAYWGASCGPDQASGYQDCNLNGFVPYCSPDSVQCINDRVRACYGGFFGEVDCLALGGICDPYPTAHCARSTDACKQTDADLNVCTGDEIQLCVAGERLTLDCTSVGLKCRPGPSANSGYCG